MKTIQGNSSSSNFPWMFCRPRSIQASAGQPTDRESSERSYGVKLKDRKKVLAILHCGPLLPLFMKVAPAVPAPFAPDLKSNFLALLNTFVRSSVQLKLPSCYKTIRFLIIGLFKVTVALFATHTPDFYERGAKRKKSLDRMQFRPQLSKKPEMTVCVSSLR